MSGHPSMQAMTHRPTAAPQSDHHHHCQPQPQQTYHVTGQAPPPPSHHGHRVDPVSSGGDLDYAPPRKMARPCRPASPLLGEDTMSAAVGSSTASRQMHRQPKRSDILSSGSGDSQSASGAGAGAGAGGGGTGGGGGGGSTGDSNKKPVKRPMFSKEVTATLREWLMANLQHPFPTEDQKRELMARTDLSLLQINNWFINARRRTVQPLIDEQNRRYMQSREFSALSHYHHHHHQPPPPLTIPRLAGPSGVAGDYGVVAAPPGAWVQGVHFDPQSPSAAAVTAASGPVLLHHHTAATMVAQPPRQHHPPHQQQHHAHPHAHQQGMVLAASSLQPTSLGESSSELSLGTALPTPPSLTSNPSLSPITVPGYQMSSGHMPSTIVTHSPTGPARSSPYQSNRGSTFHLQAADSGNVYVPGAAGGQTILAATHTANPHVPTQISPLTTPPSTAPTFYTFNHPTSPYTSVQQQQQQQQSQQ
ncbi:homeobox protein unc-62-like isoform X2 [Sycon ciliatum]